jgi:hypothetical protein
MAKARDGIISIEGTLGDLVIVNYTRYGKRVRRKRGTVKKAVLNESCKKNQGALLSANSYGQTIKHAFDPFRKEVWDGGMWPRLLSIFQKCIAAAKPVDYALLKSFEFTDALDLSSIAYVFPSVISDTASGLLKLSLRTNVYFPETLKLDGYKLSIIMVSPDSKTKSADVHSIEFEEKLNNEERTFEAEFPLPEKYEAILIAVKVSGYKDGAASYNKKANAMRIVEVVKA